MPGGVEAADSMAHSGNDKQSGTGRVYESYSW